MANRIRRWNEVTYPPGFRRSLLSVRRAKGDPLAFLEHLAQSAGDVVAFSLAGRPTFLVKHPDLAEAVLVTDQHKFVKADGLKRTARLLGNGLLTADGERHRRQRHAVQPAFHRQQLERYAGTMVGHAADFANRWAQQTTVDITAEAGDLTLAIVGDALFGANVEAFAPEIRRALREASDALDPLVSLLAPPRLVRGHRRRLLEIVDALIAGHQSAGGGQENLVSLLLDSLGADPESTASQVRDDALTILLAGHETIANALVWTWILLARHPLVEKRLEREADGVLGSRSATARDVPALSYTRAVIAESLRVHPPAWVVARTAAEDCELGGIRVPAGAIVLVSQYLMHRDARFFPDPTVFEPDRWLDDRPSGRPKLSFLPFGAGPRACIGEGFAWMETILLIATFAQRWRLRLSSSEQPVPPRPKITWRPPAVRMVLKPRTAHQGDGA